MFRPSGLRQARCEDVKGGVASGPLILPLGRPNGGSALPLKAQEVLIMAEGAECIPGTEPGGTRDPGTYDKKHQAGRLFADMQAAKELEKRRKTPKEKGANSTTVLKDENLLLKEQVRKLSE